MDREAKPCHQLGKDVLDLEVENERRNLNISLSLFQLQQRFSDCVRESEQREREREMKKSGGVEKKRVRRSSGAVQNGGRDPNSDTPPRVCLPLLFPDLGFIHEFNWLMGHEIAYLLPKTVFL